MSEDNLLKTPKGRAIIKLGIYLLFFVVVAFLFHASNGMTEPKPKPEVKKDALEVYKSMTNYEYTYQYNDTLISGKVYRNAKYFTINDISYYVNENVYKVVDEMNTIEATELDKVYYLDNHDISNYIEKGNIIGKNEDFENNIVSITYGIDQSVNDLGEKLSITTYEKDNLISKVTLKIENNISLDNYTVDTIEINYFNLDKVINFIKDFKVEE